MRDRLLGLPEPSIQVETGGKSVHTYWQLKTPLPPGEWEPLQGRLIELCGSDKACKDSSRVMRLPGCWYIGPDGTPTNQTTIFSAVIGAQSENKGQNQAFAPPFEWVADLVATARRDGCKVWLKTNLLGPVSGQWPGMQMIQEVPA